MFNAHKNKVLKIDNFLYVCDSFKQPSTEKKKKAKNVCAWNYRRN